VRDVFRRISGSSRRVLLVPMGGGGNRGAPTCMARVTGRGAALQTDAAWQSIIPRRASGAPNVQGTGEFCTKVRPLGREEWSEGLSN
jgi:hypothetical protein